MSETEDQIVREIINAYEKALLHNCICHASENGLCVQCDEKRLARILCLALNSPRGDL